MTAFPRVPGRKSTALHLSPWLMVGLAAILGLAVAVLAVRNTQREKRHMSQNLMDRAEVLIWALEAGTRTWMGMSGGSQHLQVLLEETAKQPGIAYMAVTDREGLVQAHSDATRVGKPLHEAEGPAMPEATDVQQWRLIGTADGSVFEVYKNFTPQPGFHHGMWRGTGDACPDCGMGVPIRRKPEGVAATGEDGPVIFVGLAAKPFEDALSEDYRNTAIVALLVLLLGFGGFISMFWAQNYRLSRRMLQDTRAFASEVVTNLPLGLVASDPQGVVTLVNGWASSMLGAGRDGLVGTSLADQGGLDWGATIADLAEGHAVLEQEREVTAADGKATPVSLSASRIVNEDEQLLGYLFILRNLAEVKRLQDQVRRNERLTALGNLAAGVAHEIRNPLSSIKGFATFLAGKVGNEGPEREAARMMVQEVDRLNRVVSELLEFARPSDMSRASEDINRVIERTLRLASADARAKGVTVRFVPDSSLAPVPLNAERFTQALLNLLLNAIQAMDAGGTLEVSAGPGPEPGRLAVRVADTGKGMPPDVLSRIFNPYFTTKPSGTGLGLAIVHRIVEGHGGEIKVRSRPGDGTVFTILLPASGQS